MNLTEDILRETVTEESKEHTSKLKKSPAPSYLKTQDAKSEIERYKAILQHPEFKSNPLLTLRTHIRNTLQTRDDLTV